MIFREAKVDDIWHIHTVRNAVKENILSDPDLVLYEDYEDYLTGRGKGFVCESDNQIVGFAIADLTDNNIWALFVQPEFENKGLGRKLHDIMLAWYFSQTREKVWLSTEANTRAAEFYKRSGWTLVGDHGSKGEVKFEMTYNSWVKMNNKKAHLE